MGKYIFEWDAGKSRRATFAQAVPATTQRRIPCEFLFALQKIFLKKLNILFDFGEKLRNYNRRPQRTILQ